MNWKVVIIYLAALACYSVDGLGATPSSNEPLPFTMWKEHQIVEAKNQVVRLSNRIHLLKTGRYKVEAIVSESKQPLMDDEGEKEYQSLKDFKGSKVDEETLKQAEEKVLKKVQERMKIALGNLQYAKELNIDDYLAVYLSRFKDDDQALKKVIGKLSSEELVEILKSKMVDKSAIRQGVRPNSIISELQPTSSPVSEDEKSL